MSEPKNLGFYRFAVGDIEVICVSDGTLSSDIETIRGVDLDVVRAKLAESFFPDELRCATNNYIIRSHERTALVDTGSGSYIVPTAGKMLENARAAGIEPADIDTILFTHIQPDHISGLMDENFNKVFPHATIKMSRKEFDFWLSDDPEAQKIEHVKHEADHVIRFATPYLDQIELFDEGEVFPGVTALPLPGHTPGHTGFVIGSGEREMLIWGDVVHWPIVQFAMPDIANTYDVSPTQAAATRWDILGKVASSGMLVAGMHLFFPGFIRVRREGAAFAMVTVPWGHDPFAPNHDLNQ